MTNYTVYENETHDEERAFYNKHNVILRNCSFDGLADGESAIKECSHLKAENCFFNLRYPFWHNSYTHISSSTMTELCRAALWYGEHITITNTKMHGIKALRECHDVLLDGCNIISPEFGWSVNNIKMSNCTAVSEYFMMRSNYLDFENVNFKGKYSFQYVKSAEFNDCVFDTKDAFWHSENVTVKNSVVKGEYLGWYSDHLTFINCKISGTQPLCYCTNLTLVDCEMTDTDLCFEKSDVNATITTPIISIKNLKSGLVTVPGYDELIFDDETAKGEVIIK